MKFEATNGCAFDAFKAGHYAQMPLIGACVFGAGQVICEVWNVFPSDNYKAATEIKQRHVKHTCRAFSTPCDRCGANPDIQHQSRNLKERSR